MCGVTVNIMTEIADWATGSASMCDPIKVRRTVTASIRLWFSQAARMGAKWAGVGRRRSRPTWNWTPICGPARQRVTASKARPLDQMTTDNDREYFSKHPEDYMHLHPGVPRYGALMAVRDRFVAAHPGHAVKSGHSLAD